MRRKRRQRRQFLPTIDLWNPGIQTALMSGQLQLIPGQWVRCGGDRPSRFCGVTDNGTIVAVHPSGHPTKPKVSMENFKAKMSYWKSQVNKD